MKKRVWMKKGALLMALLTAVGGFRVTAFGDGGNSEAGSVTAESTPFVGSSADLPTPQEELWKGYVRFFFVDEKGTPLTQGDFSKGTLKSRTDKEYTEAGPNNSPTDESTIPPSEFAFLKELESEKNGKRLAGWYIEYLDVNNEPIEEYRGMRAYFDLQYEWTLQHDQQGYRFIADYVDADLFSKRNITVDLQGGSVVGASAELNRQTIREYAQKQTVFGEEFVYLGEVEIVKEGSRFEGWKMQLLDDHGNLYTNRFGISSYDVWDEFANWSWTLSEQGERHFNFVAVWDKNAVKIVDGAGSGASYSKGEVIEISADDKAGSVFKEWVVEKGGVTLQNSKAKETTFVMPQEEVQIRAVYTEIARSFGNSGAASSYSSVRPDPVTVVDEESVPKSHITAKPEAKKMTDSAQLVQDGKSTAIGNRIIHEGRTMLPLRHLAQAMGLRVSWDAANKTVKLLDDRKEIVVPVNTVGMKINGQDVKGDRPILRDGRVYLSVGTIARVLGLEVGEGLIWNEDAREISIKPTKS